MPFHSVSATFQVLYFLNIWCFLMSLFWMKQIQGSVRVKMKEYVRVWSEFLFVSLVIFNFFPQMNHFYYFTSLHGLQDWKITALTWEISSWRLVEKFYISAFPVYYSLFNWIGEHQITKLKKKERNLLRIQKKRTQKQAQKQRKEMEWHKMDHLIYI